MSAHDPVKVTFHLPDEQTASWLDRMIAIAGLTPDAWLTDLIHRDRTQRLEGAADRLSVLLDAAADRATPQGDPETLDTTGNTAPARPAHARAPKGSSSWRT